MKTLGPRSGQLQLGRREVLQLPDGRRAVAPAHVQQDHGAVVLPQLREERQFLKPAMTLQQVVDRGVHLALRGT